MCFRFVFLQQKRRPERLPTLLTVEIILVCVRTHVLLDVHWVGGTLPAHRAGVGIHPQVRTRVSRQALLAAVRTPADGADELQAGCAPLPRLFPVVSRLQ